MNIRKIIKEEIDEFDWARELLNQPVLPRPDGQHHLVLFKHELNTDESRYLLETLMSLGWYFSDNEPIEDKSAHTVSSYSRSTEAYIVLKPKGLMAYGSRKSTCEHVNHISWDATDKVYWSTQ